MTSQMLVTFFLVIAMQTACSELKTGEIEDPPVDSISLTDHSSKVTESHQLKAQQKKEWDLLFEHFLTHSFYPVLEKNNLQQDCKKCADIYTSYIITIGSKGEVVKLLKDKHVFECPGASASVQNQVENEIQSYVNKLIFPASLYNTTIKGRFGEVTKC